MPLIRLPMCQWSEFVIEKCVVNLKVTIVNHCKREVAAKVMAYQLETVEHVTYRNYTVL